MQRLAGGQDRDELLVGIGLHGQEDQPVMEPTDLKTPRSKLFGLHLQRTTSSMLKLSSHVHDQPHTQRSNEENRIMLHCRGATVQSEIQSYMHSLDCLQWCRTTLPTNPNYTAAGYAAERIVKNNTFARSTTMSLITAPAGRLCRRDARSTPEKVSTGAVEVR